MSIALHRGFGGSLGVISELRYVYTIPFSSWRITLMGRYASVLTPIYQYKPLTIVVNDSSIRDCTSFPTRMTVS